MIILAHRGYWKTSVERNKKAAFERCFKCPFGLETDIRDYQGELVISHDIPDENYLKVARLFELYQDRHLDVSLALNIKADGLQIKLKSLLAEYRITNYFVFDMAVPDGLGYVKEGFNVFTRQSEYEKEPTFYEKASGVWLDEFHAHWINKVVIEDHIRCGKKVCIVSPELHKRDYQKEWAEYRNIDRELGGGNLMICTDYPEKARRFFYE